MALTREAFCEFEQAKAREFTAADLAELDKLDAAACAAMEAWLYDPQNAEKIEANKRALEARARGLADHGTALIGLARVALTTPTQTSPGSGGK